MDTKTKKSSLTNPYDAVGYAHNAGLDYILSKNTPADKIDIKKVIDLTSKFMVSVKDTEIKPDKVSLLDINYIRFYEFVSGNINAFINVDIEEYYRDAKMNKTQICYINDVLNVSDNLDLEYEKTLGILLNIENTILNSELTEREKQYPLITVAVAKYSVQYWINQINDPKSKWIDFVGGSGDLAKFKWPWRADGAGAAGGAISGGVSGAVSGGPIGALIGAAAGALGGAIGNSVRVAIENAGDE